MVTDGATTLMSIEGPGASLTLTVQRQATRSRDEPWFDTAIMAEAFPFAGTIRTVFTSTDLQQWGEAMIALTEGTGGVILGGGRAAELAITARPQTGGPPNRVALEIDLTPSGDDPYPTLRYLIFDVPPSWTEAGSRILELA